MSKDSNSGFPPQLTVFPGYKHINRLFSYSSNYPTAVFTSTGISLTNATAGYEYIVIQNPDGGKSVSAATVLTVESSATLNAGGLTVVGSIPSYQLGANCAQKTIAIAGTNFESAYSQVIYHLV